MENKQLNLSEPENIMGTMDVNPLLIKLSIPMMISMLVQALYNVVDSIFVARVSENALTAVSLAFSLQNLMFAVGIGTGVGVNALLSKSLGEKNQYRANKTAENGLFLALCSYLVFLVLGLTVVRPYFYAQTADADIAEQGIRYLTICCVLSLGMFMQVMNEKLLAATSRTTLSMISQLVGAVVNIILDPIFQAVFEEVIDLGGIKAGEGHIEVGTLQVGDEEHQLVLVPIAGDFVEGDVEGFFPLLIQLHHHALHFGDAHVHEHLQPLMTAHHPSGGLVPDYRLHIAELLHGAFQLIVLRVAGL